MEKTTNKQLARVVEHLNEVTGNPLEYSTATSKITWKQNAGHFYVQHQEGGYRLEQLCEHGARDVSPFRGTKTQVYNYVHALLKGIELGRETAHV